MPVPAVVGRGIRHHDEMSESRRYVLVAAGTDVRLDRLIRLDAADADRPVEVVVVAGRAVHAPDRRDRALVMPTRCPAAEFNVDDRRTDHEVMEAVDRDIVYWFRPTVAPQGGAPIPIRERWVGIPLPVRRPRPVEGPESYIGTDVADRRKHHLVDDGVAVDPHDAIAALRFFGENDAADWWEHLLVDRPLIVSFVFRRAEGDLLPPRLARMLHPELDDLVSDLLAGR